MLRLALSSSVHQIFATSICFRAPKEVKDLEGTQEDQEERYFVKLIKFICSEIYFLFLNRENLEILESKGDPECQEWPVNAAQKDLW